MPLTRNHTTCWVLTVDRCDGELADWHADEVEPFLLAVAEVWAAWPERCPPIPWQNDVPCLLVQCRSCGLRVGDGEHFADAEHAWEAAENDGWQGDVCPFCQPVEMPA
ncbi:hypothetical protein ACIBCR_15385 [Micromonospora echinospora]|uniref:hypothetical protein n=1 Tax=Micromonospora echinospora TaxID=1877 RepID=UPI0037BE0EEC